MGILQRFSDIMKANVNDVVKNWESKNAEKLLEQYLRDAKDNYEEVKAETAAVIADEMAAGRRVTAVGDEITKYEKYAEAAVQAGNDGDALKFLEAKATLTEKKTELEAAYETAKQNSDRMRQMTKKLVGDIQAAESKMSELNAKLKIAESKESAQKLNDKIAGNDPLGGFDSMVEAVQKRIDEVDAKSSLNEELADTMDVKELEKKYRVSDAAKTAASNAEFDLLAMKARLGK